MSMSQEIDRKIPVSISLPESVLNRLDETRSGVARSAYILHLLKKALPKAKRQ